MKFKYLITFALLFVCIIGCGINAMAMETGFDTEEVSDDEFERLKENNTFKFVTKEPKKESIRCFAVSDDGLIALGVDKFLIAKAVYIYNSDGEFQYGYTFTSYGTFGVEFNGDYLDIYFVRSALVFTLNKSGEIVDIHKVKDVRQNNLHKDEVLYSTTKEVGDIEYTIRNDLGAFRNFFSTEYSQIVISIGEEEKIIYDVSDHYSSKQTVTFYVLFVAVVLGCTVIIVTFIKVMRYKRHKNKKDEW